MELMAIDKNCCWFEYKTGFVVSVARALKELSVNVKQFCTEGCEADCRTVRRIVSGSSLALLWSRIAGSGCFPVNVFDFVRLLMRLRQCAATGCFKKVVPDEVLRGVAVYTAAWNSHN